MNSKLPYKVEYTRSRNSTCQVCDKKIKHKELRLSVVESVLPVGKRDRWHHVNCFFKEHNLRTVESIDNYLNIKWKDKQLLRNRIDGSSSNTVTAKSVRRRIDHFDHEIIPSKKKKLASFDNECNPETIEKQDEEFSRLRVKLNALEDEELLMLIKHNTHSDHFKKEYKQNGKYFKHRSEFLDTITDIMLFGALSTCKICSKQVIFEPNIGYKCIAFSQNSPCCLPTMRPHRRKFDLPETIKSKYEFMFFYKPEIRTRIISVAADFDLADQSVNSDKDDYDDEEIIVNNSSSGLEISTRVLENYSEVFVQIDITWNINNYWSIQIQKDYKNEKYWLVQNSGRIGMYGDQMLEIMTKNECIHKYNHYRNEKIKVKYVSVTIVDNIDLGNRKGLLRTCFCELTVLIFNENFIKKEMKEKGFDWEKIPLGKISEKAIEEAEQFLQGLEEIVSYNEHTKKKKLIDRSKEFYSLIPHAFGRKRPPVIDNIESIKSEMELVHKLKMMMVFPYTTAFQIFDQKLLTVVNILDKNTNEFRIIQKYVKNSHSPLHCTYRIEMEQVYVVTQDEQNKIYELRSKDLGNKIFLWHGTWLTNIASILFKGLQVSPTGAARTGSPFGKGIYFTDIISAAAEFSGVETENPDGVLLLCEVALGKAKQCSEVSCVESLPENYNSIIAKGRYQVGSRKNFIGGVDIPLGKCQRVDYMDEDRQELDHNEYIVFNPAQVKIRYLVQVKFDYKDKNTDEKEKILSDRDLYFN